MSQTPKSSSVDTSLESTESSIKLPVVKNSLETKGVLQFTLDNTNVSIANAIRRTILSDIPIVIIDTKHEKFNILQNTTRFNNEILKQRLGCIPIHIKNLDAINDLTASPGVATIGSSCILKLVLRTAGIPVCS